MLYVLVVIEHGTGTTGLSSPLGTRHGGIFGGILRNKKGEIIAALSLSVVVRSQDRRPVKESRDVTAAVARQAPGTWLPVTVARNGGQVDLVAKFPPEP